MSREFLVTIIVAVILGIAAIVQTIRATRRKKPVWAYSRKRVIGIGSVAPPELNLTFNGRPVKEVYQTDVVFFNGGTEAMRREDVKENITMLFKEAEILREPIIKSKSKEAIGFSAKRAVKDGDGAIELDFAYLSHNDGAIIEVLHTSKGKISCGGTIIDVDKISYFGEFAKFRREPFALNVIRSFFVPFVMLGFILAAVVRGEIHYPLEHFDTALLIVSIVIISSLIWSDTIPLVRYLRFPKWSRIKE